METTEWSAHRRHLVDIAFRMLGDIGEAEDAVQEAYTRLVRNGDDGIDDVEGWLVVVVSRICLDVLGSARVRRTAAAEPDPASIATSHPADPGERVTLDDDVRLALQVVLDRLTPAERTAFVLHDVFQFSFDAIGDIVGRTPEACRQLASRARRRVRDGTGPERFAVESAEQRRVAERFIAACSGGDLAALLEVLDPDVVGLAWMNGQVLTERSGVDEVSTSILRLFGPRAGTTLVSLPARDEDEAAVAAFRHGRLRAVLHLRSRDGRIVHIESEVTPPR